VLLSVKQEPPFATTITDGFRVVVAALARSGGLLTELPPGATYTWPTWEVPRSHERLKPAYAAMQKVWGAW
jgi:hypothetical protein